MTRKASLLVIGTFVLLGAASPATAVDQGKAKYVGGTLVGVKPKTEAPISLLEQSLVFVPKGARIEIPWSAVDEVTYSARGMGAWSRTQLGIILPYSLFFTRSKKHCVTLFFHDPQDVLNAPLLPAGFSTDGVVAGTASERQFAAFEFDKGDIRVALSAIKLRTGRAIACEGEDVANPIEACSGLSPGQVAVVPTAPIEPARVAAPTAPPTEPTLVAATPLPVPYASGPRVRVLALAVSDSMIAGEFVASDDTTITIRRTRDEPLTGGRAYGKTLRLPRESVTRFERSLRPGRKLLGAGIGMAVGFAAAAVALCGGDKCGDQAGMALAAVGGIPGALLGAAIAPGERWAVEDPRGVRIGAGPAPGGRLHVGLVPKRHGGAVQVSLVF